jgi:TPR repeat protein
LNVIALRLLVISQWPQISGTLLGPGAEQDLALVAGYFKRAADLGNLIAVSRYGVALKNGEGVDQDLVSSVRYFKMAADQADAQ